MASAGIRTKATDFFMNLPWPTQIAIVCGMFAMGLVGMFFGMPEVALIIASSFAPVPISIGVKTLVMGFRIPYKDIIAKLDIEQIIDA